MTISPNNGNNNYAAALKDIADAANEVNKWSAFAPFLLSDSPNELNFSLIDIFSIAHLQPCEKEMHLQQKQKRSDKSSCEILLRDL